MIEDLSFLQKALPVRVDAIIGLDVLGQTAFVIDYAARQIHLGPLPALPDAIPLHMAGGLAIIDAQVNNLPARLLLDTGASSLFLFARSTPGAISDVRVSAVQQSSDTIGESERKEVKLHSLRLGAAEFAQEPAFLVPDGSHGGHPFDGLISPAGLGIRRVASRSCPRRGGLQPIRRIPTSRWSRSTGRPVRLPGLPPVGSTTPLSCVRL